MLHANVHVVTLTPSLQKLSDDMVIEESCTCVLGRAKRFGLILIRSSQHQMLMEIPFTYWQGCGMNPGTI